MVGESAGSVLYVLVNLALFAVEMWMMRRGNVNVMVFMNMAEKCSTCVGGGEGETALMGLTLPPILKLHLALGLRRAAEDTPLERRLHQRLPRPFAWVRANRGSDEQYRKQLNPSY